MGQFLNPGNQAFAEERFAKIYVDKTGLLEYTNSVCSSPDKFVCNSRPRRFGKSYTADMLAAYYSKGCDSRSLFEGLEISSKEDFTKYLNQCEVIHFDVQWFLTTGETEDIVKNISDCLLQELREEYSEINLAGISSVAFALSRIYAETGKQFIVIVDEWDAVIRDEIQDKEVQEEYINFLRGLFKGTEPSKYIRLAYLTGILPVKRLKTESALNNFREFTMVSPGNLAEYIGFTDSEVQELCREYGMDYEGVKRWYDGYLLGEYQVYNPNAVSQSMQRKELGNFWTSTGSFEALEPYININFDGLKTAIIEMLSGTSAKVNVNSFQNDADRATFKNKDDVITYLIHLGYLAYDQKRRTAYVPNEEIRQELFAAVAENKWTQFHDFERDSDQLLQATLDEDEEAVAEAVEKTHDRYASSIWYNNENSLSSVLTIAYLSTLKYYFKPVREFPTGKGFADIVYVPRPEYAADFPVLLAELIWDKKVQTAIDQIKERRYPSSLLEYNGDVLLIGITYDKKSKEHECRMERVWKE